MLERPLCPSLALDQAQLLPKIAMIRCELRHTPKICSLWLKRFLGAAFFTATLFSVVATAAPLDYGVNGLNVHPPSGFVDSESVSPALFEDTRENAGLDGVLLKIYLPDDDAQFLADGRPDTVTRQLCLYGVPNSQTQVFDKRALDLMAKSLEGAWGNHTIIPPEVRRNRATLEDALREAATSGTPLLIHSFSTDTSSSYLTLLSYPLGEGFLSQVLCTSLVLVGNSVVLVTASSIIEDSDIVAHTTWARNAAESAADMLQSVNK